MNFSGISSKVKMVSILKNHRSGWKKCRADSDNTKSTSTVIVKQEKIFWVKIFSCFSLGTVFL